MGSPERSSEAPDWLLGKSLRALSREIEDYQLVLSGIAVAHRWTYDDPAFAPIDQVIGRDMAYNPDLEKLYISSIRPQCGVSYTGQLDRSQVEKELVFRAAVFTRKQGLLRPSGRAPRDIFKGRLVESTDSI